MGMSTNQTPFVAALIAKVDYLQDLVDMYELELGRLRAERDTLAARVRALLTPRQPQEKLCPTK